MGAKGEGAMKVHLRLYTGRPDPRWEISDPAMQARVRAWCHAAQTKSAAPEPRLTGYRGCEIVDGSHRYYIYRDCLLAPDGKVTIGASGFEDELIGTNPDEPALLERVRRSRAEQKLYRIANVPAIDLASIDGPSAPRFYPSDWNSREAIRSANTCYTYANNVITENNVMPFRASWDMTGYAIEESLVHDGLKPLGQTIAAPPPDGMHIVAAVVQLLDDDSGDCHFFRLDADRTWSHKPGDERATNKDENHMEIRDLSQARFHAAYTLVGFYLSTPEAREILTRRDEQGLPLPMPEPQALL
jgi:hypothetical protein